MSNPRSKEYLSLYLEGENPSIDSGLAAKQQVEYFNQLIATRNSQEAELALKKMNIEEALDYAENVTSQNNTPFSFKILRFQKDLMVGSITVTKNQDSSFNYNYFKGAEDYTDSNLNFRTRNRLNELLDYFYPGYPLTVVSDIDHPNQ
jgi:hypothetical protein